MNFLYFIPNHKRPLIDLAELDAIGLSHMHSGVGVSCTLVIGFGKNESDPKGVPGLLLTAQESTCPPGTAADVAYAPDHQTWRRGKAGADGNPLFWVGYWTDKKPTAASLVRKKHLGGVRVPMLEGDEWSVPVAASKLGMVTLPLAMTLSADDKWAGEIAPQYRHMSVLAGTAYDRLLNRYLGRGQTVTFDESMEVAEAALSVNYRVGRYELALLGCVGSEALTGIMEAICDWESFREGIDDDLKKFLAAASSNTASGATAETLDTNPPGPTSDSTPSTSAEPPAAIAEPVEA